jgi:hypothetical protein
MIIHSSTFSPTTSRVPLIAIIMLLLCLGSCDAVGDSQSQNRIPVSSTTTEQLCSIDVGTLRRLRDDLVTSRGVETTGTSRSQETLQRWMEKCAYSASMFDRIAVSGLWNRLGQSWALQNEDNNAIYAFGQALSLLRPLPQSEELLVALRGKADCEWKLERRKEGLALAKEQLDVARTMYDGSAPTALYLVDALEFSARFAGMDGNQAEAIQFAREAQNLQKSIDTSPATNSVPAPIAQ